MSEKDYENGSRMAWTMMLQQCLLHLGYGKREELRAERLILEREQAITALRSVCADHGDNDWEPSLCLADIVNKHLSKHLPEVEDDEDDEDGGVEP